MSWRRGSRINIYSLTDFWWNIAGKTIVKKVVDGEVWIRTLKFDNYFTNYFKESCCQSYSRKYHRFRRQLLENSSIGGLIYGSLLSIAMFEALYNPVQQRKFEQSAVRIRVEVMINKIFTLSISLSGQIFFAFFVFAGIDVYTSHMDKHCDS